MVLGDNSYLQQIPGRFYCVWPDEGREPDPQSSQLEEQGCLQGCLQAPTRLAGGGSPVRAQGRRNGQPQHFAPTAICPVLGMS